MSCPPLAEYEECSGAIPEVFSLSPSTVSRRFIRASARKLRDFIERRLDRYVIAALVIDGKTFKEDEMIIALGVTMEGEKVILGFIQAGTENARVCTEFLQSLIERKLTINNKVPKNDLLKGCKLFAFFLCRCSIFSARRRSSNENTCSSKEVYDNG